MFALTSQSSWRVHALDFWGFGLSQTQNNDGRQPVTLDAYAQMVVDYMDAMGIKQAPVAGHSMGGTVALVLALQDPQRITDLILVAAPVAGFTLNPFLKFAGYQWTESLARSNRVTRAIYPVVVQLLHKIILSRDSERVRQMILRDLRLVSMESFFQSIGALKQVDLRSRLGEIQQPLLGIYGRRDNLVSPENATYLMRNGRDVRVKLLEGSRHFPMNDDPDIVAATFCEFLADAN